ncbi:proton-coupled folate transporter isoform X3 [Bombyx mori]|uniref:Adenylate cyclase n=1 Tax=Bombyx mori TaxID=7091 RepID=A0A8R2QSD5_BOMMO|nr:proton-coupled folate transporter-like isoform X2 [Bombyx mori]
MTESMADIHELDKLSPAETGGSDRCCHERTPHKWRLLLEPALVGSMMAINLGQTSLQNFYLRTACTVDLNYTADICDRGVGEEFRKAEAASQIVVSSVNISRSFIGCLLSTIILLFVGPWSDCSGRRKPLLIMPLIGMCVTTSAVIVMLIFPGASTVLVLYAVQIPIALGGNFGLLLAAAFSYLGDVCHATGRDVTRTMGTHRAAIQIAQVAGAVSGPLLYTHLGFYGVFPLVLLLQISSLLYVQFVMQDVNVNTENRVSVFNWKLPLKAFKSLIKSREGHKRKIILLMLLVSLGDRVLLSAEVLIAYMYYRYKFHWDDIMFGSFLAYKNIISFFVPLLGIISQGSQVVQRPLLNKQILPTEQGKIYSVMGALQSAIQTLSSPLYSLLYSRTVSTFPDAWLLPGLGLALIQLTAYLIARRLRLKSNVADNDNMKVNTEDCCLDIEDKVIKNDLNSVELASEKCAEK